MEKGDLDGDGEVTSVVQIRERRDEGMFLEGDFVAVEGVYVMPHRLVVELHCRFHISGKGIPQSVRT